LKRRIERFKRHLILSLRRTPATDIEPLRSLGVPLAHQRRQRPFTVVAEPAPAKRRGALDRGQFRAEKSRIADMKNFTPILLAATVLGADATSQALAASSPNSLTMTCAQVQNYVRKHGQTLLTTGKESGNYSFDYADCGGTVPGFACTTDEAYCYVGWWCDYNYPAQVNSQVHDQGTESCPARRSGARR
jgi:hypothetical protein